jgi:neutral amino acid transport system permease protein
VPTGATVWPARRVAAVLAGLLLAALTVLLPAVQASATTATTPAGAESAPAEGAPASAENIRVRVILDREGVADVDFTVSLDGTEIGTGTTDAEGQAVVPVPGPGTYQVELDTESLEEGVQLTAPDRNPSDVVVNPAQTKPVAFPLFSGEAPAERPAAGSSGVGVDDLPQLIASGLRFGLIIALAAIGLSVIFGTTGLTNFAHGELITFGAVAGYILNIVIGLPFEIAAVLAVALGGLFGFLNDRILWQPLRRRGTGLVAMMIVSIGLGLLLRYFFGLTKVFGTRSVFFDKYQGQVGMDLGLFLLRPIDIFSMVLSVVVLVAVGFALIKTRIGKATRAVADNPALAAASGINVDSVIRIVWVVGGALAALSGILLGMAQGMNYFLGFQILLLVFAAVTLGGLGTAFGALIGSIIVGVFVEVSTIVVPSELKYAGALFVLIIVLLVRPQGILGRRERIG